MALARGVAALGDSGDIGAWSGIPYHLLRAGQQRGFLTDGLDLRIANIARLRGIWQAKRILAAERPRGFQYSGDFLHLLGERAVEECCRRELHEVITHFQLLPARYLLTHTISTSYYIDTTLLDLFETHEMLSWLNSKVVRETIERERDCYQAANRIVTMSSWVRASLESNYDLPAGRISTVLPGANLPEKEVKAMLGDSGPPATPDRFTQSRRLRIGFTGKDWKRKGLPRLVSAVEILNRMDVPSEVVVVGSLPEQYRDHPGVCEAGFIDKSRELSRFINIAGSCDFGCAPSHEEPMGIAPLEYLRLGIPVLCTAAGGLKDVCRAAGSASILLSKDATAEEIAVTFESLAKDGDRLRRIRAAAWERKDYFSWDRTVQELQRLWDTDCGNQSEYAHLTAQSRSGP